MVKIEEDPDKKRDDEMQNTVSKIQSCLNSSDFSFTVWTIDKNGDFGGNITKEHVKYEKRFFRKKAEHYSVNIATLLYIRLTSSIYLKGDDHTLMKAAQELEENGYNVTICV
jgi:hypothetical protein